MSSAAQRLRTATSGPARSAPMATVSSTRPASVQDCAFARTATRWRSCPVWWPLGCSGSTNATTGVRQDLGGDRTPSARRSARRVTTWSGWRGCVAAAADMRCDASTVAAFDGNGRRRCVRRCAMVGRGCCAGGAARSSGHAVVTYVRAPGAGACGTGCGELDGLARGVAVPSWGAERVCGGGVARGRLAALQEYRVAGRQHRVGV